MKRQIVVELDVSEKNYYNDEFLLRFMKDALAYQSPLEVETLKNSTPKNLNDTVENISELWLETIKKAHIFIADVDENEESEHDVEYKWVMVHNNFGLSQDVLETAKNNIKKSYAEGFGKSVTCQEYIRDALAIPFADIIGIVVDGEIFDNTLCICIKFYKTFPKYNEYIKMIQPLFNFVGILYNGINADNVHQTKINYFNVVDAKYMGILKYDMVEAYLQYLNNSEEPSLSFEQFKNLQG